MNKPEFSLVEWAALVAVVFCVVLWSLMLAGMR